MKFDKNFESRTPEKEKCLLFEIKKKLFGFDTSIKINKEGGADNGIC